MVNASPVNPDCIGPVRREYFILKKIKNLYNVFTENRGEYVVSHILPLLFVERSISGTFRKQTVEIVCMEVVYYGKSCLTVLKKITPL